MKSFVFQEKQGQLVAMSDQIKDFKKKKKKKKNIVT